MSKCQVWYYETSGAFDGGEFCMGLGGCSGWCHGTAMCSQGLASNRSLVNKNAMFLADADWKSLCLDLILAPKQHFCVQSDQLESSFFCVKVSMCASKTALHFFLFFSHSSRWLGPFLPSWALGSTLHSMEFWWNLIWYDLMSCFHFRMLRLEGKSGKGLWYSIQARCDFLN